MRNLIGCAAAASGAEAVLAGTLTRVPRRRRLPAGGAGLRRRLTPLAARCSAGPYYPYCSLRPRTASGARGTRGQERLTGPSCRLFEREQAPVATGALHELRVCSLLDDSPVLEHRDVVRERDRRRTVRDHERRPASHPLGERRADLVLLRRVDGRRRVVEDENRRVR